MPASKRLYDDIAESFRLTRKAFQDNGEALEAVRLMEYYLCLDLAKDNPCFVPEKFRASANMPA